ncbi:MAG: ABC transporter ATP-binding protein, partial [Lachnospiraceae bacterium]|nr:ABC transporter ATP-binding protein [Lachnospiraceae bacterium]
MRNDLTDKISFREGLVYIRNIISHIYNIDRSYYFLAAIQLLTDAGKAALTLVLSADILELLYRSAPVGEIGRPVAYLLALTFILSMISSILKNEFILPARGNIRRIYEGNLFAKIQQMDYSLVDSPQVRKLSERIAKANNWGAGIYSLFWDIDAIVSGICNLVCSMVVAFPLLKIIVQSGSLWMYLGLVVLIGILYLLTRQIARANAAYQQRLLASDDEIWPEELRKKYSSFSWYWVTRCMGGDYHFVKDVQLYEGYDLMEKYTVGNMRESEKAMPWMSVVGKLRGRLDFLQGTTEGLMMLAGYVISAAYAMLGAFPVGDVIKFAGSITSILAGAQRMGYQCNGLLLTARRAASTLEMLSISDEMYKGKLPVEKRLDNQYEIEFRNVTFRYPGTEKYALKHFSMKLRIGERMAIVGMNGSGKTTMIKLLCRLYDPQEG